MAGLGKSIGQRAAERVEDILAGHEPEPLLEKMAQGVRTVEPFINQCLAFIFSEAIPIHPPFSTELTHALAPIIHQRLKFIQFWNEHAQQPWARAGPPIQQPAIRIRSG